MDEVCPNDLNRRWWHISYIPEGSRNSIRPEELEMGSGNHSDRAWRLTTGRFDVVLAVLDSGFDWNEGSYVNKIVLNAAELPLPQYADGSAATSYDLDGNGLVNIQDYVQDARVSIASGRDAADGRLDPSDLIYTFSDSVDDDNNGFTDDIAGWDFFADDNDAWHEYADDFGTHGSGVIEDMAAEGGDGDGDIGVCPNCGVLPIRVGDTFVTDGSRAGMAILYATDMGAAAINLSIGALTGPEFARDAAAYARAHNVGLSGAAGDENAYHHNQPAMYDGFLYVHSIHPDVDNEDHGAYTYLNFFNCNNFGDRVDLSADSPACATGATAITTGVIGLVKSIAKDRGLELTADEVWQIITRSATDIHLSAAETDEAHTYPSSEGWDPFFGYGRIDAGKAVEAVANGEIPPAMDIRSPGWFDTFDDSGGKLDITGYIAADRSTGFDWIVEYGTGNNPSKWTELGSGHASSRIDGTLATLDLTSLPEASIPEPDREENIVQRLDRVNAPAVTVRIRATDDAGVVGSFRKTFFVHRDPGMLANFPLDMGESGESSPILADLDGDDVFEIIIGTGGGRVHAYTGDGSELAGWPVTTAITPHFHLGQPGESVVGQLADGMVGTVAVGDLDGDGSPEVVAATGAGFVYAWHADGSLVDGFPAEILGREPEEFGGEDTWDNGFAAGPSLYDLDGDGSMEIVAAAMDERLYVFDQAGADWGPYPIDVCAECDVGTRIITTAAIGDVDGDGDPDLGLGNNETVDDDRDSISWIFDARTGVALPGWPVAESGLVNRAGLLPIVGEGHPASMAFADLDGDGTLEISSPVMLGNSDILKADGTLALDISYFSSNYGVDNNTTEPSFVTMTNNPSFGDMTGDGVPEFLIGGAGTLYLISLPLFTANDYQNVGAAWDGKTGEMLPGWPRQVEDLQFLLAPAVADLTGDGKAEAIYGSAGYMLYAWDAAGNLAKGWPKFTGGWVLGSPAVGDIDGDGYVDVVASTREGKVFAWTSQGPADQKVQWASIHHDPQNTGNYETPLAAQIGPPKGAAPKPDCECGVTSGNNARGTTVVLSWLGLVGLLWRRRRA